MSVISVAYCSGVAECETRIDASTSANVGPAGAVLLCDGAGCSEPDGFTNGCADAVALDEAGAPASDERVRKSAATACRNGMTWLLDVPVSCSSEVINVPSGAARPLASDVSTCAADVPSSALRDSVSKLRVVTSERTAYESPARRSRAATIIPLVASMLTCTPVIRCGR